ncbi:DUF6059 family protein [Salinispora arenicola]|uniref:DUF6059 family protein n=1 Tax=Salinispora arenicola TaxID=168697 RepID=UPI0012BC8E5C|nr:hypothetical protein [Salinispora arenicola]
MSGRLRRMVVAVARATWRGLVLCGSSMAGVPLDETGQLRGPSAQATGRPAAAPPPDRPLTAQERVVWRQLEDRIAPPG